MVFFVNDTTVSKGMVKYVGSLPSESIVDVEGVITKPEAAVDGCTQKQIEIDVRFPVPLSWFGVRGDCGRRETAA